MDTGSPAGVSVSEDVNSCDPLKKLYTETSQYNCHVPEDASLHELGNDLAEFLHIEDAKKLASKSLLCQSFDEAYNRNQEEDKCEDQYRTDSTIVTSEKKIFSNSVTFPRSCKKASLAVSTTDGEDNNNITAAVLKQNSYESVKPVDTRSISLPTPSKLVSAMKGSREKQGTPPKKLSVTWAPDVYDPTPSPSTFVRIKKTQPKSESKKKYDKKNGKNKQKGKSSSKGGRGSSKDKKQARKYFGALGDFEVGSPETYCGSSFLQKSITNLQHFSVAEAT
ncbi:hypothetical protein U1Q18_013297 [Sarracenia purpurea var. burkii]